MLFSGFLYSGVDLCMLTELRTFCLFILNSQVHLTDRNQWKQSTTVKRISKKNASHYVEASPIV